MAPEQLNDSNYSNSVDVWACGITMYNLMFMGEHPIFKSNYNVEKYASKLKKDINWKFPEEFSELGKNFFSKIMRVDPLQRYSAG
jgi:calcium/calmodulin-dependent protein kinase I